MKANRNVELMYEVGTLRNIERGWRQHFGVPVANIMEHSFRVGMLALVIARMEKQGNEEKILKMAMVHDLAEIRTVDLSIVQKVYVKSDEHRAIKDTLAGTLLSDLEETVLKEYEERKSVESRIVKDADNLDIEFELRELAEQGHKLATHKQWRIFRRMVRDEKLYTKSAKKLWDDIQKSDPQSWHLEANKWVRMPEAGK